MTEEVKTKSTTKKATETPVKEPKLVRTERNGMIVGSVTLWDKKTKQNIKYPFNFPGVENAVKFTDLADVSRHAYWDAFINGNDDLGLNPLIGTPSVGGKPEKMSWKFWENHSGVMKVCSESDRFLVQELN